MLKAGGPGCPGRAAAAPERTGLCRWPSAAVRQLRACPLPTPEGEEQGRLSGECDWSELRGGSN